MSAAQLEKQEFQAEVRQILDIVIHSLYTDKEIFIRELISNASDALEKMRLVQLTETADGKIFEADRELEINISTDETAKTITISDHGIGMTREELKENLGTIAHSGTKAFLEAMKESGKEGADVIGQFGVGFYSSFMVAERVEVYTHSWREDGEHLKWESDGDGGYSIEEAPGQHRGCRIVVHLKDEEFAQAGRVRGIIERYSNFVAFPVNLNGERINTMEALWLKPKAEISEEDYKGFYQFIGHAGDDPRYTMHFSADAPLAINALVFVPGENMERFGMGPQPAGVALYCHKVLIDQHPEGLLPEWLRFLKGVIDSEDLPLNISRESMQDSALVRKLGAVITKRFLKHLEKQAKEDPAAYREFFSRFGRFIREGVVSSPEYQESLAGLLRFQSSMTDGEELTSLDEYVDRAKEEQEEIYYLVGPSREALEKGPHFEAFHARGLEVAFFTEAVDDYVLEVLREYKGKKLVSADRAGIELEDVPADGEGLSEEETGELVQWLNKSLGDRVEKVEAGKRLVNHPVAALLPENAPNAQMRAMMAAMGQELPEAKAILEINPRHALVVQLEALRKSDSDLAGKLARQLTDNALLAAGLDKDPAAAASGMNELLEALLKR
ncbi:MAG: molecular chaperone HtpG [Akkermansiaceae bacterium]|nr:molecular chaperone HtpG [Akkermansiaceae bacterium]NNM28459.1 molecular chaperone HtpG [Akkermansiaceae bacterium]